jgi:hypothetical protein
VAAVVAAAALVVSTAGAGIGISASLVATAASVSTYATIASTAAMAASQATAKPPASQGQVNDRIIGANSPQPYLIGRSYSGGAQVHDVGYGGTVGKVENPYRFIATVHSCCGPLNDLEAIQLDFETITFSGSAATGFYADYFWSDWQFGDRPEADALVPVGGPAPGWSTAHKLSGYAAIGYSLRWDKDGKKFAGGQIPAIGAIWEGVRAYDPRLDSTVAGGSGSQRITDETTWTYTRNPALHALAYAYGRYVNGVKVFGVDLSDATSIDIASVIAWANTCDTNSWTVNGVLYEPGDKWNNLKRICETGAADPVLAGGVLRFDFQAPRTSLYTITKDDLADGEVTASLSKGWKNRHNTLVPRYRSEAHQWNHVQAEAVNVPAWVTADGEIKSDERQWDLVTDVDQVTELAIYDLYQRREAGPFRFSCKSHMRAFAPGDCLTLGADLAVHPSGAVKAVVKSRTVDPVSGTVTFEFEQETDAKHTAAVGATGTAPPVVTLPTGEEIEDAVAANNAASLGNRFFIRNAAILNPRDTGDVARALLTASDVGATATISVARHDWDYPGGTANVQRELDTITGLAFETTYHVYFDDDILTDTTPTYVATTTAADAENSTANTSRHPLGKITTPANGAGATSSDNAPGQNSGFNLDALVDVISNPDGTINPDAIVEGTITQATKDEWAETRTLAFSLGDYQYINAGGLIFPSGGEIRIHAEMLAWMSYSVSGLTAGDQFGVNFAVTRWSGGAPGSAEDLADYIAGGATLVDTDLLLLKTTYDGLITSGTVYTEKRNLVLDITDTPPAGDYWYSVWAYADSPATIHTSDYQRFQLFEVKK